MAVASDSCTSQVRAPTLWALKKNTFRFQVPVWKVLERYAASEHRQSLSAFQRYQSPYRKIKASVVGVTSPVVSITGTASLAVVTSFVVAQCSQCDTGFVVFGQWASGSRLFMTKNC